MLRILLLSDIHFIAMADEMDDYYDERALFLQDLEDCHKAKENFDHVFVCGDIAGHGKKEEYDKAFEFFGKISDIIHCPIEEFYVIPGNHDKDWNLECVSSDILHSGLTNESLDVQDLFNRQIRKNFELFKELYSPFKEYNEFALKMNCIEPLMSKCLDRTNKEAYNNKLDKAYCKSQLHELDGYKVWLYGFNTALASDGNEIGDDNKGHNLFLPRLSYHAAVDDECINICMMHHPTDKLVNGKEIANYLDTKFPLQIYGHLHRVDENINNALHIMSGAFQPPDDSSENKTEYLPAYHIIELEVKRDVKSNTDKLQVKIWVERYRHGKFEHNDEKKEPEKYVIELPGKVKRWTTEEMEKQNETLPVGTTVRKIQYEFIHSPKAKKIMKELNMYDTSKSLSQNVVLFLNRMYQDNRMSELWNMILNK